jgi:23S rRNA pseudouridine1911/1915/1917 synthase
VADSEKQGEKREASVPETLHGVRLDQVAAELFPEFSRSKLASWIREGALTLDGATVKPREKVTVGAVLSLTPVFEAEVSWAGEDRPLDIIFEDEHVIVLNKPAGLVVHPAAGNPDGTLVNALIGHAPELEQLPRGGIVHRLDKETSGIMFVARSPLAHKSLVAQLAERSVSREYCAIVRGVLVGGGTVDEPIDRHPSARVKMAVVPYGKPAITHYRVEGRFGHHTQLKVNLETGRTHQIRVHMAFKKHPLIGDPVYGGRPQIPPGASTALTEALRQFPRQALHARTLTFEHPASGETVSFTTDLPDDMQQLIATLRAEDPYDG